MFVTLSISKHGIDVLVACILAPCKQTFAIKNLRLLNNIPFRQSSNTQKHIKQ